MLTIPQKPGQVHKCDITKIQISEIMRFVSKLFRKNQMKKVPFAKNIFLKLPYVNDPGLI